jgi:hypothetical protein
LIGRELDTVPAAVGETEQLFMKAADLLCKANLDPSHYYDLEILPSAIKGLRDIGPDAKDGSKALENITHDPNTAVANAAAKALGSAAGHQVTNKKLP